MNVIESVLIVNVCEQLCRMPTKIVRYCTSKTTDFKISRSESIREKNNCIQWRHMPYQFTIDLTPSVTSGLSLQIAINAESFSMSSRLRDLCVAKQAVSLYQYRDNGKLVKRDLQPMPVKL